MLIFLYVPSEQISGKNPLTVFNIHCRTCLSHGGKLQEHKTKLHTDVVAFERNLVSYTSVQRIVGFDTNQSA